MNELQIFQNDEFGSVRTLMVENEPWFVGKDVATALGYADPRATISKKVDTEDRGVAKMETPSGAQDTTIINESGLYSLILSSKLPNAKKFKRWVTSEVLPAIRKSGSYALTQEESELQERKLTTDDYIRAASIISTCKNERLPYVFDLLKKGGIRIAPVLTAERTTNKSRDTAGRAANAINTAILVYGLNQSKIAKMTGISRTQIARILSGKSKPYITRAKFICNTLHKEYPDIPEYTEN